MAVAARTENQIEPLGQGGRPPRLRRVWSRRWVRRAGVVIVAFLLWLAWSIGGALTAPGTDSTAARLAEWARFHALGWAVSALEQAQYQLNPPKVGGDVAGGIPRVASVQSQPSKGVAASPGPPPIQVQAAQPLKDEGAWQPLVSVHGQPAIRAAFLRPDAQHTSYLVGVALLDQHLVRLVLHPGFQVPGGSGWSQPFDIPPSQRDALVAAFNSGFTMVDANGGYWQDGKTAVPLRPGAASMVLYKDGRVDVVRWDGAAPGPDVAAVRQNLGLLVDRGTISPDVDSTVTRTWGKTLGNRAYVWRTALGIRRDGSLVFVVGSSMSVSTLAKVVHDAGAVRAMELDINTDWTNFITYTHPANGVAVPHMLTTDERPNPYRYFRPSSRDFVSVLVR